MYLTTPPGPPLALGGGMDSPPLPNMVVTPLVVALPLLLPIPPDPGPLLIPFPLFSAARVPTGLLAFPDSMKELLADDTPIP